MEKFIAMNFIRLSTWKGKIASFLCLIYAYDYKYPATYIKLNIVAFLLLGLLLGAIWASLVNNFYDIEVDRIAGKPNGMGQVSQNIRVFSLLASLLSGFIYCWFLLPDFEAVGAYVIAWVCFFLYSSSYFRLKEKPFLDLLTDGLASQLFPALFIFAYLTATYGYVESTLIIAGSTWLFFSMGVRALIMHQYRDEEKDRQAGIRTYVTATNATVRHYFEALFLLMEILAFCYFAFLINISLVFILIVIYAILLWIMSRKFQTTIVYFNLTNEYLRYRIFLYDVYALFALSLLVLLCIKDIRNIYLLFLHIVFFHSDLLKRSVKAVK